MGYNDTEGLVGRRIDRLHVDDDSIAFDTDKGLWAYQVEGGCCSTAWMADVIGFSRITGKVIAKVSDDPLDDYSVDDGRCRQDEDSAYGIRLTAEDGAYAVVIYRCSSNGYYGGWISKVDRRTVSGMTEVESDWKNPPPA